MIIVLETSGKTTDVQCVKVTLFEEREEAEKYCEENTDFPMDEKYWRFCEIIESGKLYEPARYKNYEC